MGASDTVGVGFAVVGGNTDDLEVIVGGRVTVPSASDGVGLGGAVGVGVTLALAS